MCHAVILSSAQRHAIKVFLQDNDPDALDCVCTEVFANVGQSARKCLWTSTCCAGTTAVQLEPVHVAIKCTGMHQQEPGTDQHFQLTLPAVQCESSWPVPVGDVSTKVLVGSVTQAAQLVCALAIVIYMLLSSRKCKIR